jgi:hypothetical protein
MKQVFAILAVVMVFGMVACSNGNGSSTATDSTAVDSTVVDSSAVVADTATAVEVTADTTSVK